MICTSVLAPACWWWATGQHPADVWDSLAVEVARNDVIPGPSCVMSFLRFSRG